MKTEVIVEAKGIGLEIEGHLILQNINLQLKTGEIVSLIGPNGAGKTTFAKIVLGLLLPTHGKICRSSNLISAYLPQKLLLQPTMPITVQGFLELGSLQSGKTIDAALAEAGVAQLKHSALQAISGGELQRVMLARCLLRNPQLLVLDEPDQGMDASGQQVLFKLITDIRDRYRCAILMISHDLHLVMAATDQVICLNRHVCCTGHPESISKQPEFLQMFGKPVSELAVYSHQHNHKHDLHGNVIDD